MEKTITKPKYVCVKGESDLEKMDIGDFTKVSLDSGETLQFMVYEGPRGYRDSFIIQQEEGDYINSWQTQRMHLNFINDEFPPYPKGILINVRESCFKVYKENSEEYEGAKQLLINANRWRTK